MFRTLNLGSSSGTHYLKSLTIYTVLATQQATNSDKQDIKTTQIIQLLYNF
jgi:hypothetical protein